MQNLQHNAYVDIISLVAFSKKLYPYILCVSSREGYSFYIENRFQFSKSALEFPIIFLYSRIYWLLWCQISRKRLSWSVWAHVFVTYATCRFYCTLETHLDIIASLFQHTPTNETFQEWNNLKNDVNMIFIFRFSFALFRYIKAHLLKYY